MMASNTTPSSRLQIALISSLLLSATVSGFQTTTNHYSKNTDHGHQVFRTQRFLGKEWNGQKRSTGPFFLQPPLIRLSMATTGSADNKSSTSLLEEALELKAQAERMRLEAEQQDATLTLTKIKDLEEKLGNRKWLEKHPDQEEILMKQLDALQDRLVKGSANEKKSDDKNDNILSSSSSSSTASASASDNDSTSDKDLQRATTATATATTSTADSKLLEKYTIPLEGFEKKDLDLYLPVGIKIDETMPNSTMTEKLEAFHSSEELKDHFADKIKELFLGPIQDFQEMEYLKEEYMSSSSSVEKENLKRRIQQIENTMNEDERFLYCESIYRELPVPTEEYIQERVDNISKLPSVLQAMYKRRSSLPEDADLRLAIELDHYDPQIQLLEQVPNLTPLSEEQRQDAIKAFNSLSLGARANFASGLGVKPSSTSEAGDEYYDTEQVITKLTGTSELQDKPLKELMNAANAAADAKEYDNDIEVIDRSRWIFELIPASGRLENFKPTDDDMDILYTEVFGKKTFAPSSKPERVGGGYYVRGVNRFGDDESANDECMAAIQERMESTGVAERLQIFYLLDPAPATDEEIETGDDLRPLLYVTANDPSIMYNPAKPLTKGLVTASALFSTLLFGIGSCGLNNDLMDQLQTTVESGGTDISMITDPALTIALSIIGIQVAHEVAHGVIAFRDKIKLGVPNLIPSIQLGLTGAITSFQSPPKNLKSMFDFALAGPLAGFLASLVLLSTGLGITSSIDLAQQTQLPVLPIELLRSSTLIGGLVETTLGSGALLSPTPETALLPLHPLAIAGVAGLYSNALALLPLGHTDGGRIATAMFGRRGAYLVKSFTTLLLAAVGLFGLDNANIFLLYILFASIWQRELDAPAYNEVDELDLTRGLIAIATLVLVAVTLVPVL